MVQILEFPVKAVNLLSYNTMIEFNSKDDVINFFTVIAEKNDSETEYIASYVYCGVAYIFDEDGRIFTYTI